MARKGETGKKKEEKCQEKENERNFSKCREGYRSEKEWGGEVQKLELVERRRK
jgi:hypothetical protein